jgi:ABC-type dipeptide/oligopeptide/nickel transport system ATPase subunit
MHAKVYRFFSIHPKREIMFVGSVNLTTAAHHGRAGQPDCRVPSFGGVVAVTSVPNVAPLLEVDHASLGYGNGVVVNEVSLTVAPGDAIGIAGESGSGKSTLAKGLIGDIAPLSGSIRILGKSWADVGRRDPDRRRVQMVFQDPYSALNPRMTGRQTVTEVLRVTRGLDRKEARFVAEDLLVSVGLSGSAMDLRPQRLSGGMRQRVVLARAMASDPEVLIADEPTSALDVSIQAQILDLLIALRAEMGLALVLVTHDLAVLKHMTDRTLIMRQGFVVEDGPTTEILENPQHEYTRALVAAQS